MILSAIVTLADAYSIVIFVYVMMSWFPMQQGGVLSDIYDAFGKLCEPFLTPFRKLIPPIGGMVDITPIIALLVLQFGVRFIVSLF
jgi:YggT family protein